MAPVPCGDTACEPNQTDHVKGTALKANILFFENSRHSENGKQRAVGACGGKRDGGTFIQWWQIVAKKECVGHGQRVMLKV